MKKWGKIVSCGDKCSNKCSYFNHPNVECNHKQKKMTLEIRNNFHLLKIERQLTK